MNNQHRFVMCMECKYAVWPHDSLGECHHPSVVDVLTMEARNPNGVCGPNGNLWEKKNGKLDGCD